MLVRMAPDAIERLSEPLTGGSIVVSSTNGKTTTAGMIAEILRGAGREPGPQPRRLQHALGSGDRPARAEGRRGPLRGRRGVAAARRAAGAPAAAGPRQPLPRPARPLRRARAPGRRVGRARRADSRARPVRPVRRRPAGRRPRPRPRPAPARGRHLLRHRGPEPGAARAPARARREALPPLRRALRLRARLRRPPRPLHAAPTATPTAPSPTSPRRRSSCAGCPAPGSR